MAAAVVLRQHFNVLVVLAAIDLVLDAKVRKVHAVVEVRQLVVLCPAADFLLSAVRSSVAIGPVAVVVLEKVLVLPFEVLFKDDAADIDVVVLLSETRFFFAICGIQVGVVIQFSRAVDARVERLGPALVALSAISVEQAPALVREDDRLVVFAKRDGPNQPFVAEVVERVVVGTVIAVSPEVLLRHDTERANRRKHAAVLAIQLVDSVAVDHQLARVAARQVQVVHQAVARIVFRLVTLVVHARTPILAFSYVIPSRIVHRPSCVMRLFGCP
jgi:hypothetical protein